MTRFIEVRQALQELVTQDEVLLEPWRAEDFTLFAIDRVINKQSEQFRFLFASDVDNFTEFPQGFVLAEDGDRQYRVEKTAGGGGLPNANVAIGQRTMLLVVPTRLWSDPGPPVLAGSASLAARSAIVMGGAIPNSP